ncbi:hypothetical protein QBC36DRAFT_333534 [Triangularia setosa]|uniref:Uncharacterized protein n=1 Tax=Triangularia setosa TaxID=2587417 RepID=A0AAN6W344_9PEZI|nr:hypothetical protein QBC36DRAFT_333534 [Podospora setosa]
MSSSQSGVRMAENLRPGQPRLHFLLGLVWTTRVNGASSEMSLAEEHYTLNVGAFTSKLWLGIKHNQMPTHFRLGLSWPAARIPSLFPFHDSFVSSCAVTQTTLGLETYQFSAYRETLSGHFPGEDRPKCAPARATVLAVNSQGHRGKAVGAQRTAGRTKGATSPDTIEQHPRPTSEPAAQTIMAVPCRHSATSINRLRRMALLPVSQQVSPHPLVNAQSRCCARRLSFVYFDLSQLGTRLHLNCKDRSCAFPTSSPCPQPRDNMRVSFDGGQCEISAQPQWV